jgi:type IV pilus assembly protein PilW
MLPRRSSPARSWRGVSLVELMIGMTLGLMVVAAASLVLISSRQASRSTDSLGRMQETLRTSFELMARELREAGGNPCDTRLTVTNVLNNAQGATPTWWVDWTQTLRGFDGAQAFTGVATGAATGERVAGTDAVMVKFIADVGDLTVTTHDTATAVFSVNNSPHAVRAGDLLMACDYRQAALLSASAITASTVEHKESATTSGNCSRGLGLPTVCTATGTAFSINPGGKLGRLVAVAWYIGNNGRADSGARSLYRVTRNGAEEVAEGVSDLQLQYLVAGAADYVAATAVTTAQWADVVGMRVTLTLTSAETGVSTATGGRLQRPLAFTLSLRNRMP